MSKIPKFVIIFYLIAFTLVYVQSWGTNRISGGKVLTNQKISRHIVSVRVGNSLTYFGHRCGGAIITSRAILTAAHCVLNERKSVAKYIWVIAGTLTIHFIPDHGLIYEISNVIVHPAFRKPVYLADIAILRTAQKIDEDGLYVLRIPLPDKAPVENQNCLAAGWGAETADTFNALTDDLHFVNQSILLHLHCPFPKGYICAGDKDDVNKSAQEGDSGGPLICDGKIYGIVSHKTIFEPYKYYVNVWEYRKWIEENNARILKISRYLYFCIFFNFFLRFVISIF